MKNLIITITVLALSISINAQTVIEMMHPADANLVLLEVEDSSEADIVIYKTANKDEYREWDCMWKFKKWGFSNFSIYLAQTKDDPKLHDEEYGIDYPLNGKIYFTDEKEARGYKTEGFMLEGVFRKYANNDDDE